MMIIKPPQTNAHILLQLLADGQFHSGQDCAEQLGLSRTAVNKLMQKLQVDYDLTLDRITGRGYRLVDGLDLFDAQQIQHYLSSEAQDTLTALHCYPELTSTNLYLMQQIAKQAPLTHDVIACLAEHQTQGRGRHGKSWYSPFASNVYCSLLWTFARDLNALRGLSLLVGLAVARYLHSLGVPDVSLKWPNDIMIQGKKVGGILLEVVADAAGPCTVVMGIGLNIKMPAQASQIIDQPWTDLSAHLNTMPTRNEVSAALLSSVIKHCHQLAHQPMSTFIASWQAFDNLFHKEISCQTAQGIEVGIAQGVNENGELLIKVGNTQKTLNSGEVRLL